MYQLFIFFMITDPKTTVRSKTGQCVTVFAVAAVEMVLRLHQAVYAPFYALFLVGPAAMLLEMWMESRRARLRGRACLKVSRRLGLFLLPAVHPDFGAAPSPRPSGPIRFVDATAASGISFRHHSGAFGKKYLPETMGSGVCVLDYDNDGFQDILFVNSMDWPGHGSRQVITLLFTTTTETEPSPTAPDRQVGGRDVRNGLRRR